MAGVEFLPPLPNREKSINDQKKMAGLCKKEDYVP
jgi:hypothetical protein